MIVALEGLDAAGKRTQAGLLRRRLVALGLRARTLSFPRYAATFFGQSIASYLNGRWGPLSDVDPHLAGLLYAGDRLESRDTLLRLDAANDVLILDRYVASNLAYQGARVARRQRREFITWLSRVEYGVYRLPRARVTVYLDMPLAAARELLGRKARRSYTRLAADLYERDAALLAECATVYRSLQRRNHAGRWVRVRCATAGGRPRPVETIAADVWRAARRYLRVRRTS